MYNFYTHQKEARLNDHISKVKKSYIGQSSTRKKLNSELSQIYRKRIEGFVMGMIDKPILMHEFKNLKYTPREEDTSKFIGGSTMYFNGFRRQTDRINSQVIKNGILDEVPFQNTSLYKFRQASPCSPAMKFKPRNTIQRLEDQLASQRQNVLDSFQSIDRFRKYSSNEKLLVPKITSRNILPVLHKKTHFKSMETIFNEYPVGCLNRTKQAKKTIYESDQGQEIVNQSIMKQKDNSQNLNQTLKAYADIKKSQAIENFNPRETSKQAMTKCNLVVSSVNNSPQRLKPGDGKEVHSNATYRQVYRKLYRGKVKLGFMR